MSTIKHGSTVNKTDFWSRNCLKIAGTADFRRKNGISWISRAVPFIFSWNFAHWCEMEISKMWWSLIFEKHFFPAENAGNCCFCRFLSDFFLIFRCFFSHKNMSDITFSFIFSFVRSFVRSLVRSFVHSYFHYQVGPISMWLVSSWSKLSC